MRLLRPLALAATLALPLPALAHGAGHGHGDGHAHATLAETETLLIEDGYVISAMPDAPTGAAFMLITNRGDAPDRLVAAEGDAAARIELHTHVLENGVARMVELEDGIELPPGETVALARGGLHVMLMGLTGPLEDGAEVPLTLVFEKAGPVAVVLPVDRARVPNPDADHRH